VETTGTEEMFFNSIKTMFFGENLRKKVRNPTLFRLKKLYFNRFFSNGFRACQLILYPLMPTAALPVYVEKPR
jgi:hypothetical protein